MTKSDQEIEVKFYLGSLENLQELRKRLEGLGAKVDSPRVHETNLRFDTPGGDLTRLHRVLRLRQDTRARVTYKGPGQISQGAQQRLELEFTVSDYSMAKGLFEALGYQVSVMYEKFRTTYALDHVLVTLDEMPYGSFAEVEGPDGKSIQRVAERLMLDWNARFNGSYTELLDHVRQALGLTFRDLTFDNFKDIQVPESAFGFEKEE